MTDQTRATDPIRLGVIGTGLAVEKLHWPALRQMPDRYQIVAFANRGRPAAEHFAAYTGAPMSAYTPDYHQLLRRDDVDAVLISLPIPLNYPATRDALQAGKHVIGEKPAGANLAEGRAAVELAAQYPDRVLLIAENYFYRDDLRLARSLLDQGAIGRPHLIAWRTVSQLVPKPDDFSSTPWRHHPEYDGGPHLDGGVHHLAQFRLLLGDADRVAGETQDANATHGGPSDLTLTLRFVAGPIGAYTAAYPELAVPDEPNEMRLYGTDAVMSITRNSVSIHRPDGTAETHRLDNTDGGYYNEFLDFANAVQTGDPVVGTVAQSYRNMELVLAGLASAERGQTTVIDPWPAPLSPAAVPLWRPPAAPDLFAGLPTTVTRETTTAE